MIDYGPPIRLGGDKPGGVIKIKRGGSGKTGNSGSARRLRAPVKGLRDFKKPGKHGGGTLLPKPPDGPAIWDPRDPFIIEYRKSHGTLP